MKKSILLTLLFFIPLLGVSADFTIDERKSDIYFANGIMTTEEDARLNLDLIIEKTFEEQYDDIVKMEKELNFDTAYNQTFGYVEDFYESYLQLADEDMGWGALRTFIKTALVFLPSKLAGKMGEVYDKIISAVGGTTEQIANMARNADLSLQISKYRESIRAGHSVIIVAHSQGNLFTNEAYRKFTSDETLDGETYRNNGWLKQYFTRINIASPSSIKEGGDIHITFHNDPINHLSSLTTTVNPNKSYTRNALNEIIDYDGDSTDFHAFKYYMGEKSDRDSGEHLSVSTDVAQVVIMNFLENSIQAHRDRQSQWQTKPELESDKGTKEYRVTVEHRHEDAQLTSKMVNEKVFPFAPYASARKLYQVVNGASNDQPDISYVLASLGGEKIIDIWDGQDEEIQFYKLEGTGEIIEGEKTCKDPSLFEIISHENKYTENWRVTVKNIETNEMQSGVYPFNLNGSLYQLPSNEWVLASCGGINILSVWDEQKEDEIYKLKGTDEKLIIESLVLKYDNIKFVYFVHCDYDSWCAFYRSVMVYVIGSSNRERDELIGRYYLSFSNGGANVSYPDYNSNGYFQIKPPSYFQQHGKIFFQTSDINQLKEKIGESIILSNSKFTANFALTQSDFDKTVE